MKEKFEHKLIQKIKDVFDSGQPDFNPQDWENMKARLTERPVQKAPVFWNMVKVASVLLILVTGSYFIWQRLSQPVDQVTEKESENSISISQEKPDDIQQPEKEVQIQGSRIFSETKQSDPFREPVENATTNVLPENINANDSVFSTKESSELAISTLETFTLLSEENETTISELSQNLPSENSNESKDLALTLFPDETNPEIILSENHKQKQKVKVGVELVSFTNYAAEDLEPEMNFGAGLTASIPIKSRFLFSPGLIFTSYSLSLTGQEEYVEESTFTTTSGVLEMIENNPDIKPSEINLTGLDIPVNFQYRFIQRKSSDYFVELGFSNLLYLSESYSYSIAEVSGTNPDGTYQIEQTFTEEITAPAFKTFDFASLINFSLGWDYKLNKSLDLTLNPYLKYPVSDLSSGDFKFGSGGLKLKLMLKPSKK
jgi:hypothetical protein